MRQSVAAALAVLGVAWPVVVRAQDGFGGAQDVGLARQLVEIGRVPGPEQFSVDGMLREHDFPIRKDRCPRDFCVLASAGRGLDRLTGQRSGYLFLEPVSGIDPERWERPPLNLAIVLDRSGSMDGWKIESARRAVDAIVDRLGPRDRLAIVVFDDNAQVLRRSASVVDRAGLHALVRTIGPGGATNIEAGLAYGFEEVARGAGTPGAIDRVLLLTDALPNVGSTDAGSFLELSGRYAARGIGLGVFGVGLDFDASLVRTVTQLPGGTAHTLTDAVAMQRLFGSDFGWIMTAVATDLVLEVDPGRDWRVAQVHGVPADRVVPLGQGVVIRAGTVMLDGRRSGAVLRLEPATEDARVMDVRVRWSYRDREGRSVEPRTTRTRWAPRFPDALAEFEGVAQYRAYALVNLAQSLCGALVQWHSGDRDGAIRLLTAARNGIVQDTGILRDRELAVEAALAERLLGTMRRHLGLNAEHGPSHS